MVIGLDMNLEKGMMDLLCYHQNFLRPNETQQITQCKCLLSGWLFPRDL